MAAIRATNRTQRLVPGFFVLAWIGLVAILLAAPQIYDATLKLGPGAHVLATSPLVMAEPTYRPRSPPSGEENGPAARRT